MYEEWAHTDAILEGPVRGDCTLCNDMVKQVRAGHLWMCIHTLARNQF